MSETLLSLGREVEIDKELKTKTNEELILFLKEYIWSYYDIGDPRACLIEAVIDRLEAK